MATLLEIGRRLAMWIRRGRLSRDLDDEMALHIELRTARNAAQGLPPEQAARAARLSFGSPLLMRDASRDTWGWRRIHDLERDIRFGARALRRKPVLTVSAILTLALAIGVNIAIFALLDRVVLRPLDIPNPAGVVTAQRMTMSRGTQVRSMSLPWQNAERLRQMSTLDEIAFSSAMVDRASRQMPVSIDGGDGIVVDGRFVSGNYFRVLGLTLARGRDFLAQDDDGQAPAVVIVSHRFWRTHLGGGPDAIGRPIQINGAAVTVVGVAPATFTGTELSLWPPDLYLPLMTAPRLAIGSPSRGQRSPISPLGAVTLIARAKPAAVARAQAELTSILTSPDWTLVPLADTMLPFEARADLERFLTLLAAAVSLTLVIGCANLAGLLLARAEERRSEFAIRAALGAGRRRLVQELAIEHVLLVAAGGAAALVVARVIDHGLGAFLLPGGIAVSSMRNGIDGRTLLFTAAATLVTTVLVAVAPATRAALVPQTLRIKRDAGSARLGATRLLVGVQAMVAVVLVFGALLFVRTLSNALATDVGFNPKGLMSASFRLPTVLTNALTGTRATDGVLRRVRDLPSISAATIGPLPLVKGSDTSMTEINVDGVPQQLPVPVDVVFVSTDYFSTLGQPMLRGREFDDRDGADGQRVVIVNRTAAGQFWPGADAMDHQVAFPRPITVPGSAYSVVGIARDVKLKTLGETDRPVIYLARLQHEAYAAGLSAGAGNSFLIVRTKPGATGIAADLARLASMEGMTVQTTTTIEQAVNEMTMPQRLGRILLLLLGAMALVLMVVGIYGLVSCAIERSTKEIGIRLALGADRVRIVRPLVSATLLPVLLGATSGAILAWSGGHALDRFMYGMTGSDPSTIVLAVVLLLGTGLLAALLPMRRVLAINPIETLRTE